MNATHKHNCSTAMELINAAHQLLKNIHWTEMSENEFSLKMLAEGSLTTAQIKLEEMVGTARH